MDLVPEICLDALRRLFASFSLRRQDRMCFRVRAFAKKDCLAVAKCAKVAFEYDYARAGQVATWMHRYFRPRASAVTLAAFEGSKCIGYTVALANRPRAPVRPRIEELAVLPEYRRRGVAETLMRSCLSTLQQDFQPVAVVLRTQSNNSAARALYEKLGFRVSSHLTAEENWDDSFDPDKIYGTEMVVLVKLLQQTRCRSLVLEHPVYLALNK